MFPSKFMTKIILATFLIVAYVQVTESRPRMRHHRGDLNCSRCSPGWGVIERCTAQSDTKCGKCAQGTYSPHHNLQPCWICSRCGPGLYEAHPCSKGRADTVCDSCHRVAEKNSDYRRKCKAYAGEDVFLAPEDALNTDEESSLVNEQSLRTGMDEEERETVLEEDVEAQFGHLPESSRSMQGL